jgi:hypothetical protein
VAAAAFGLVWTHAVLAGTDTAALTWFYLTTGMLVLLVVVSRYGARTADEELAELGIPDDARMVGSGRVLR